MSKHALGLFILLLAALAVPARGADIWRLAGTFNNWNAADDQWTMTPQAEGDSRLNLERHFEAGEYTFRFVKEGAEPGTHLGRGAKGEALAEQGGDITLRIPGDGTFRIVMNPAALTWALLTIKADETVFDVRVFGPLIAGRSVLLDFSRTLTIDRWDRGMITFEGPTERLGATKPLDRYGRRLQMFLNGSGTLPLILRLSDGGKIVEKRLDLRVEPEAYLRYATADDRNNTRSVPLESVAPGVRRAMVAFAQDTDLVAIEVQAGEGESVGTQNARVPAGTYAVEVRNGSVVTQRDPALPLMLLPGNWRAFAFNPAEPADTVHLAGDFNHWARPGHPWAIDLASRADGTFFTIINLPKGDQRYRFIVNGSTDFTDAAARAITLGPGGAAASVVTVGPTPKEFGAPKPNSIDRAAVRHYRTSALDFNPISRPLGLADISLTTLPGDVASVTMTIELAAGSGAGRERRPVSMLRETNSGGFDRWTARVMTGEPMALYSFTLTDGTDTFTTDPYSAGVEPVVEPPAWALGAVCYEVQPDLFHNGNPLNDRQRAEPPDREMPGGDLQGVAEKFLYLRDLGVNVLCLAPIFESPSASTFAVQDFRHIDSTLAAPDAAIPATATESIELKSWVWTPADRCFVEQFLPASKRAGLRVVLDAAFGCVNRGNFAFQDIQLNGDQSAYKDWFVARFDDSGKIKSWDSWHDLASFPNFRRRPNGDLAAPAKRYIFDITRRWMDPNGDGNPADGIDGWRLLSPLEIADPFWRDWGELVKSINPDALIIADAATDASDRLAHGLFDAQVNHPAADAAADWLQRRTGMTARAFEVALGAASDDAPQTALLNQTPGVALALDAAPPRDVPFRAILPVALQTLYSGALLIHAGDEAGTPGSPFRSKNRPDPDGPKSYSHWLRLRADPALGPVLRYGATRPLESGDPAVFAFERSLNGVRIAAAINRQHQPFHPAALRAAAPGAPNTIDPWSAVWWIVTGK